MRILIDGDSCCVLKETERMAKKNGIECHVWCDTHRMLETEYAVVHVTDSGRDAADFAIVNNCSAGDIVVTADGGLAAMAMAKMAKVINPYGREYTEANIMRVLESRAIMAQAKRGRAKGKSKKKIPKTKNPLGKKGRYADLLANAIGEACGAQA